MNRHGETVRLARARFGAPLIAAALAASLFGACKKPEEKAAPKTEVKKVEKAPVGEQAATKTATTAAAVTDPDCVGPWTVEGAAEKREVAGKTFELQGARLKETSSDPDQQTVIGVLANIKEDTAENMKNVASILAFFKAEKADVIVVDGDLGETAAQMSHALEAVAAAGLPTFVVIGNQDKKNEYNDAVKAVAAKHPNVFNMGRTRLAVLDDVALVSLPGYYNKSYVVESGCAYGPKDVEVTKEIIRAASEKPVVLVSHGGPLQREVNALDRTADQANVGDPELAKMMLETGVKFGVFANIREAGGHATNLDGMMLIGENKPSPELFLNPGAADAVGWKMNDGTQSTGMAAVLTIKDRQGSFKVWRRPS